MVDRCVICGDIIPEGRQVCLNCENNATAVVRCPNCGAALEIMNSSWWSTAEGICKSTIFHCNVCHSDWEKEAEYIAKPVVFKRKYWG